DLAGSAPSDFSCAVTLPPLPSSATRSCSSAAGVSAAAMSASARRPSSSIPVISFPENKKGEGLAPFPLHVPHPARAAIAALPDLLMPRGRPSPFQRSEEHTSELQSRENLVCRLLL